MSAPDHSLLISPDQLRVGMYVELDLGWMAHPFALNHFKITSPEQIDALRGLGLRQLRWRPALSEPFNGAGTVEPPPGAPAPKPRADGGPADAQAAALVQCRRRYEQSAATLARIAAQVADAPADARADAEALATTLIEQMAGQHEMCLRLLGDAGADRDATHALNVTLLALLLARTCGWGREALAELAVGALLHDIGKLALPERLRHRDESFSTAEHRAYEDHVARGVAQARRLGLGAGALLVIAQHHEMADQSGFPMRLPNERMTAAARIVALVNRYDRLCHPARPHLALTPHEAVSLMFAQFQTKFDTQLLSAFVKMMGVYPPGTLVQLTDDRYALVVSVNVSRPLKPGVKVYEPGTNAADAPLLDLEAAVGLGIRRSLKPQALSKEALRVLAPSPRLAFFFEPVLAATVVELPQRDPALAFAA